MTVRSILNSNVSDGRRQQGRLTGRSTVSEFPEGELRREVVWEDGNIRWPLDRTLATDDGLTP
ncbi:hypothetical protein [Amycolatopsis sp. NBC_01286]|uniref:hypothetical protein n=1 Tax=Amycolatopsis sp. NBC_01286 TaxID=2903560 RepID=UPI002E151AC9|nr:hypothetical protein OG570_48095 [Amycolatopsis sp. NBC_01286]